MKWWITPAGHYYMSRDDSLWYKHSHGAWVRSSVTSVAVMRSYPKGSALLALYLGLKFPSELP